MRNLIAAVLLALVVAPSVPWDRLPNIIPSPAPQPAPTPSPTGTWAAIVPDAQHRAHLSSFFGDFATLIERDIAGTIDNMEQLARANAAASTLMREATQMPPNPAFSAELERRMQAVVGLEPVAIDAPMRAKIVALYRTIARELAQ